MKDELFEELLESVREAVAISRGEVEPSRVFVFPSPDVRKIRKGYGLSQGGFAKRIGISKGTVQNWEQGRRKPEGPARVLLRVAEQYPEVLGRVVGLDMVGDADDADDKLSAPAKAKSRVIAARRPHKTARSATRAASPQTSRPKASS